MNKLRLRIFRAFLGTIIAFGLFFAGGVFAQVTDYTLTVSNTAPAPNAQVTVTFETPTGSTNKRDWIGLFEVGNTDPLSFESFQYTGDTQTGSRTFRMPNREGTFEFRYYKNNPYVLVETSEPVTIEIIIVGDYTLTVSNTAPAPNAQVTVTFETPTGSTNKRDWIGLFEVGNTDPLSFESFQYTGDTQTGSRTFRMPNRQGTFEFRYYKNNPYVLVETSEPVTIEIIIVGDYTLTVSNTAPAPNAQVTVTFETPTGSTNKRDWIGLFEVGNTDPLSFESFQYTGDTQTGSRTFRMPNREGTFEFRYYKNNPYVLVETSEPVTIEIIIVGDYTLTVSNTAPAPNAQVTVTFETPTGSTNKRDWIGLFEVGNTDPLSFESFQYTGDTQTGSRTFRMPNREGTFEFRYYKNNPYVLVETSEPVTIEIIIVGDYTLTVSNTAPAPNAQVTVTFETPTGSTNKRDWIGLFEVGNSDPLSFESFQYTGDTQTGSRTFRMPNREGTFEFRYYKNNPYVLVETSEPVTIEIIIVGDYTLTVSNTAPAPNAQVTVTFETPTGSTNKRDWIGLFEVGNSDPLSFESFQYTGDTQTGSRTFRMPAINGDYEFRYYRNNPYVLVETSETVSITGGSETGYTLTLGDTDLLEGQFLDVAWFQPAGENTFLDWIGRYNPGDADSQFLERTFVNIVIGDDTKLVQIEPGTYEYRYFKNNTFNKVATSETYTVTSILDTINDAQNVPPRNDVIVAIGDSLVAGVGATAGNDFPTQLGKMLGVPVINEGISGNTIRNVIDRIDEDVLSHNPGMVLLVVGGNDIFQQTPIGIAEANLMELLQILNSNGIVVVLGGAEGGQYTDRFADMFDRVSEAENIIYIPNMLRGVIGVPSLMADLVHPNDTGYEIVSRERFKPVFEQLLSL